MGGQNMDAVMEALDGVTVALPWQAGERRTKSHVNGAWVEDAFRTLGAKELLLLLAIAKRQHDVDPKHGYREEDCVCVGSRQGMADFSRLGVKSFDAARDFLVRSGLITFSKDGGLYKNLKKSKRHPSEMENYYNVYKLNKARLAELAASPRRGAEASAAYTDDVHVEETHYTDKKIQRNTMGDGVLEIIRGYIATTFGIPRERVGLDGVRAAAKGKDPAVVREAIDKFAKDHPGAVRVKNGELKGVAWLISTLKRLPAAVSPNDMTDEELTDLFTAPVSVASVSAANPLEKLWIHLCKGLGLGELPAEALQLLKGACTRHFARYADADRRLAVGAFVDNYLASRGTASLEDLRARLGSAAECARDLSEFLNPASK